MSFEPFSYFNGHPRYKLLMYGLNSKGLAKGLIYKDNRPYARLNQPMTGEERYAKAQEFIKKDEVKNV